MRATALCLLIAALWACAAGQCHTPDVGNVGSEAQLSVDACAINDALKTSPPDYATARAIYTSGRSSKSPTLQGVATGSFPTNLWRRFASFYGDDSWMNTAIVNALDGSPPFTTDARRVKVITKTIQGGVLVQRVIFHIDDAIKKAGEGRGGAARQAWDKAMAAYYGADPDCAPFGNGQSRGIEFATLREGISSTNFNIGTEFGKGARILSGSLDVPRLRRVESEIMRNIYIIYLQSILKYASLIDQAIESGGDIDEDQAEGFGYSRAVLPMVALGDGSVSSTVQSLYDLSSPATEPEAEQVLRVLSSVYGSLGIGGSEVKTFDGSRKGAFQAQSNLPCQGINAFAGNVGVGNTDADR